MIHRPIDSQIKKKIKRHIIHHPGHFYYIVPPAWEKYALAELSQLTSSFKVLNQDLGGILIESDLQTIMALHIHLKLGIRFLWRIASFPCLSYKQLNRGISTIKWEYYLGFPITLQINSASISSWLYSETKLKERVNAEIECYYQDQFQYKFQQKGDNAVNLYIRMDHNRLNISLDLTGAPLYKRGWSKLKGRTPLRENIISAGFQFFKTRQYDMIIDPFCGGGTVLNELTGMISNRPPQREFSFQTLPIGQFKANDSLTPPLSQSAPFIYYGGDISFNHLLISQQNLQESLSLSKIILCQGNALDPLPLKTTHRRILIFTNPPYGWKLSNPSEANRLLLRFLQSKMESDCETDAGFFFPPVKWLVPVTDRIIEFPYGGQRLAFYQIDNLKSKRERLKHVEPSTM